MARMDDTEIAARLRLSATRLHRRLRQEAGSGLSPSQGSALVAINNNGPLTLGMLAEHERVAPPTITKVVAFLEGEGLVERRQDPSDKRASLVTTTKKGQDLVEESRRRKTQWLVKQIEQLTPEERKTLAAALPILEELQQ
jgi:DNA-binding MarR family transcriptional regulator